MFDERLKKMPTKLCEELIQNSTKLAEESSHYAILPEHLLKNLIIYLPLSIDEKNEITIEISKKLSNVATVNGKPITSADLIKLILYAEKISNDFGDKYISIDHIILAQCQIPIKIDSFNNKKSEIEKNIRSEKKPVDSYTGDDKNESLPSYAIDMVKQAREGKFDPVVGRDSEIRSVIEILSKKTKSNPILIGNPGVGKTAIVNAIAMMIANDQLQTLKGYKIYNVDVGSIIAGTGIRGEFEDRLKKIIKEASDNPKVVLFIDEIHMIIDAGSTGGGGMDAANMLKPGLASGDIKCIGATTFYEYRKYIEKDPAFARRFVKVNTNEPGIEDSITMLRGLRERIEAHHGTRIMDQAIVSAVKMAKKYIAGRMLPDSAIDLIDTACASAVISVESESQEALKIKGKIWSLGLEKASLELDLKRKSEYKNKNYDEDTKTINERIEKINKSTEDLQFSLEPIENIHKDKRRHLDECKSIKQKIEEYNIKYNNAVRNKDELAAADIQYYIIPTLQDKLKEIQGSVVTEITPSDVANIVSRWTGIPANRLTIEENERLLNLNSRIKQKIFGQDEAVDIVSDALITNRAGLSEPGKPIGCFLFLGPTGVGKTELAKAVCYEMFDNEKGVVIDMSDYSSEISVTKLIGASAGYIGYEEGGKLTEVIKNKPYNLVLFDEVDLAHHAVLNILYQLLDEGRVVDGKGCEVDFSNCVIIMTSNLGYKSNNYQNGEDTRKIAEKIAIEKFGPALYNRMDAVIHFNPLDFEVLNRVLTYQIAKINERMNDLNVNIVVKDSARVKILQECTSFEFGARPLKKYIQKVLVNSISKFLIRNGEKKQRGIIEINLEGMGYQIGDYFFNFITL